MNYDRIPAKASRRVGNWCEETQLRDEKLREFLSKVESGQISFKKQEKRIQCASEPVKISQNLLFGEKIMIQSLFTKGFVAVNIPSHFPNLNQTDLLKVSTSAHYGPDRAVARASFVLERVTNLGPEITDMRPRWGEKFLVRCDIPTIGKPLYLSSLISSINTFSTASTKQTAYFTFEKTADCYWEFDYPDPEFSLEMEYQVIEAGSPGYLKHTKTGAHLSADLQSILRSDFGVESLVGCFTFAKPTNLFCLVTA